MAEKTFFLNSDKFACHVLYQSIGFDFAYYSTDLLSSVKGLTTIHVTWLNLVTYAAKKLDSGWFFVVISLGYRHHPKKSAKHISIVYRRGGGKGGGEY